MLVKKPNFRGAKENQNGKKINVLLNLCFSSDLAMNLVKLFTFKNHEKLIVFLKNGFDFKVAQTSEHC